MGLAMSHILLPKRIYFALRALYKHLSIHPLDEGRCMVLACSHSSPLNRRHLLKKYSHKYRYMLLLPVPAYSLHYKPSSFLCSRGSCCLWRLP